MIHDILTILWKEFKEVMITGPNVRGGRLGLLVFIAVFGILLPMQNGPEWAQDPTIVLVWAWVPFILVNSVVADSFAGERERHTLETLLASRLSDQAIFFGKLAMAISYGWGISLASMLVSLLTLNVAFWDGEILLFPPQTFIGILVGGLLVATLAAGLGVLVSLRAASVRQAQQTVSMMMFVVFIPLLLLPQLPENWRNGIMEWVMVTDMTMVAITVAAVLLLIDLALIGAGLMRFRRARLILD